VFICKIEKEYVVSLAIDCFLDSVWLVCYESSEYAVVAHAGYYVVPIGFAQVEVSFFSEKENSLEFPVLE